MNERHIIICADDYGISPAVNAAIRDLIVRQRINATSVIVVAPSFSRAEAQALLAAAGSRAAIGLHVTLTAPFRPLSQNFAPLRNGAFLPLPATLGRAFVSGFKIEQLVQEISSQFAAFSAAFGRVRKDRGVADRAGRISFDVAIRTLSTATSTRICFRKSATHSCARQKKPRRMPGSGNADALDERAPCPIRRRFCSTG